MIKENGLVLIVLIVLSYSEHSKLRVVQRHNMPLPSKVHMHTHSYSGGCIREELGVSIFPKGILQAY